MEQALGRTDAPPADVQRRLEMASQWDLTDAAFSYEFDEQRRLYRVTYDPDQAPPSLAVITAVSKLSGKDPLELESLYTSVDPDALDALFTGDPSSVSRLTFQYSGYEITVGHDDVVEVLAG